MQKSKRFTVTKRPVHMNAGWRYLAYVADGLDADDVAAGLNLSGYETREQALAAVAKAEAR